MKYDTLKGKLKKTKSSIINQALAINPDYQVCDSIFNGMLSGLSDFTPANKEYILGFNKRFFKRVGQALKKAGKFVAKKIKDRIKEGNLNVNKDGVEYTSPTASINTKEGTYSVKSDGGGGGGFQASYSDRPTQQETPLQPQEEKKDYSQVLIIGAAAVAAILLLKK